MSERRSPLSRRQFVGGTIATVLAGCTGTDSTDSTRTTEGVTDTTRTTEATDATRTSGETTDSTTETDAETESDRSTETESDRSTETESDADTETAATEVRSPALGTWIPKPALLSGRSHYLLSDAVFWNFGRIRQFEDALHPEFYGRITRIPDANPLGLSPSSVGARVDVASQSVRVYLGTFDTESVVSSLTENGLTKDRELGSFRLFAPGESGFQRPVGVGEDAVVVGKGASIQMANDDRSSEIGPRAAAVETVAAHRTGDGRYADASESVRTLTAVAGAFDSGTVRTFERVSTPEPENLQFAGCVGTADGFEFSRPKSTYVTAFLFSEPDEAVVDPIREQFEQREGLNEYDDVSYRTDGRTVTVRARMANERFDGYLPGDPADRA